MSKKRISTATILTRLPRELKKAVNTKCKELGVSVSEMLRTLLTNFVKGSGNE